MYVNRKTFSLRSVADNKGGLFGSGERIALFDCHQQEIIEPKKFLCWYQPSRIACSHALLGPHCKSPCLLVVSDSKNLLQDILPWMCRDRRHSEKTGS